MQTKFKYANKNLSILIIAVLGLFLSACGGGGSGGGGGGSTTTSLSGTAATGAAIDGVINIYGSNGGEILNVTINSQGGFSVDVSGLTAPFFLVAIPDNNSLSSQYSFATAGGTVNITPLTSLTAFYANGQQDLQQLISSWPSQAASLLSNANLAQEIVNANLVGLFPAQSIDFTTYDFFSSSFAIGSAIDLILDQLNIAITGNSLTFSIPSLPSFTFNVGIPTAGIDIGGSGGNNSGGNGTVTISGAGSSLMPSSYLSFNPESIDVDTNDVVWEDNGGLSYISIVFINNVVSAVFVVSADSGLNVILWQAQNFSGVPGVTYDGTTVTFTNVTLSGLSPNLTINGSLSH